MRTAGLLGLFALVYAAIVAPAFSVAYIDFGDGNYLYIAGRLADGLVLYRDILAPQPPAHLLLGSLLIRIGRSLGGVEAQLYTVRTFSLLLHLATMLLIWAIARRLFARASTALWAAAIHLALPLGFWWSLGYQSEPLEMFFLLASFLCIIQWERWSLAAAGLLAAAGISTNMTAVPYAGWVALFLLWHDRRRALYYIAPLGVAVAAVVGLGEWFSGGHYLENVFFNQVGTFPHPDVIRSVPEGAPFRTLRTILGYALPKIMNEGLDVLHLEGLFVAAAIAGLLLYLRRGSELAMPPHDDTHPEARDYHRRFVGWYAFWSFLSIAFVSKGATMDYIFTIGEPFVALFAAYLIVHVIHRAFAREAAAGRPRAPILRSVLVALGLLILFARPAVWVYGIVAREQALELRARDVQRIRAAILEHSKPGDAILAPPYYAFIAQRRLVEEYSELFIWHIKYLLEERVERTPGVGMRKVQNIAAALRAKAIPVVVQAYNAAPAETTATAMVERQLTPPFAALKEQIEQQALANPQGDPPGKLIVAVRTLVPQQVFSIRPVARAMLEHYAPLFEEPIRTLNTYVNVMVVAPAARR